MNSSSSALTVVALEGSVVIAAPPPGYRTPRYARTANRTFPDSEQPKASATELRDLPRRGWIEDSHRCYKPLVAAEEDNQHGEQVMAREARSLGRGAQVAG